MHPHLTDNLQKGTGVRSTATVQGLSVNFQVSTLWLSTSSRPRRVNRISCQRNTRDSSFLLARSFDSTSTRYVLPSQPACPHPCLVQVRALSPSISHPVIMFLLASLSTLVPCPSRFQELPCLFQLLSATLPPHFNSTQPNSPAQARPAPPAPCAVITCLVCSPLRCNHTLVSLSIARHPKFYPLPPPPLFFTQVHLWPLSGAPFLSHCHFFSGACRALLDPALRE